MKHFLLILTGIFFSYSSWAADFYVSTSGSDSNSGSASAPFRTIQKAANMVTAGSTVYVAPGTYAETIYSTKSGTASARIRYVSTVKWGAKIVPPGSSVSTAWDNRGSYVDIVGFEVDGRDSSVWVYGIYVGGSFDLVKDNHIHHIGTAPTCSNKGGAGTGSDYYYYGTSNDFIGNVIHHIGSPTCNYIQGIYMATAGTIKNNLLYAIGAAGIHLWHDATDVTIANNTVVSSGVGVVVGAGEQYHRTGVADNVHVSNNIIFDNDYGISEQEGTTGVHNTYTNNLVFQNKVFNWKLLNGLTHTGTIAADPQFVSYSRTSGGDFHLKSTSPAIDKGSATYAPKVDLDEKARPQGAGYDIGAYEYASTSMPPPPPAEFKIISGPTVSSINETSAKISWSLSEPATGQVEYGTTTAYGKLSVLEPSLSASHNQILSGLTAGTTYYFRVISKNAAGAQVVSSNGTFKTLGAIASPSVTITLNSQTFAPGQVITAQISGTGKSVEEYAALYIASNADTAWSYLGNWMYLNGSKTAPTVPLSSATLKFVAPNEPGTYNIRVFASENMTLAGNRLAVSPTITVSAADTIAPSVSITNPASGSVPRGSYITVTAAASDNVGVSKVEFYVNGNLICTDTSAAYSCLFRASRWKGAVHNITARAYDAAGNVKTSAIVKLTTY